MERWMEISTKLGVCSWSLQTQSPSALAQAIKQCGLNATQLALDPLIDGDWDLTELVAVFKEHQIELLSGMITTIGEDYSTLDSIKATGGLRPDEHWDENQSRAKRAADIAKELGIDLVTLHAGFIPAHGTDEYHTITDRIRIIAGIFGTHRITLALETGQEQSDDLLNMLNKPNMSTIGINFDPANMILYAMGDPAQAIELLQDRIVQVHMKDAKSTEKSGTWGAEVPAGEGEVDWAHFFKTIEQIDHRNERQINVIIEREAGEQRIDDIIQARKLVEQYVHNRVDRK
tara:strand:- start:39219 stop:40085 length:867 start_codon:yes stop_codon:yes gene_type:complete